MLNMFVIILKITRKNILRLILASCIFQFLVSQLNYSWMILSVYSSFLHICLSEILTGIRTMRNQHLPFSQNLYIILKTSWFSVAIIQNLFFNQWFISQIPIGSIYLKTTIRKLNTKKQSRKTIECIIFSMKVL